MQKLKLCTFLCSELERVGIFTNQGGKHTIIFTCFQNTFIFLTKKTWNFKYQKLCLPFSLPLPAHTQSLLLICKKGKLLFFTNYFNRFKATRKSDFYK